MACFRTASWDHRLLPAQQVGKKMLKIKAGQNRNNVSGFSLVEMMITLAISIIVTVISVITLIPLLNQQHVTNAYNTTLAAMRLARDNAVAQRTSYSVTFSQHCRTEHDRSGASVAYGGDELYGRAEFGDLPIANGCKVSCANWASQHNHHGPGWLLHLCSAAS